MGSSNNEFLGKGETASVFYHNIFDYPLDLKEIIKWRVGKKGLYLFKKTKEVASTGGVYFLKGRRPLHYKKTLRKRISERKIRIAEKYASILSKLPNVLGVFVTGALSMNNAKEESDIDLMIITKKGRLWLTRGVVYALLKTLNSPLRKPNDKDQKDKLCLNIWLDESTLSWSAKDRNIYSAHEIAQVTPLVGKENIYQRFLQKNKWILDYWPSAVKLPPDTRIQGYKDTRNKKTRNILVSSIEYLCFRLQYLYMKSKITREVITLHKAIFHPRNWGVVVVQKLST